MARGTPDQIDRRMAKGTPDQASRRMAKEKPKVGWRMAAGGSKGRRRLSKSWSEGRHKMAEETPKVDRKRIGREVADRKDVVARVE